MPKLHTAELSEERRKKCVAEALAGKPPKAIALDHGLAEHSLRKILWAFGFRCMMLTESERNLISKMRAGGGFSCA